MNIPSSPDEHGFIHRKESFSTEKQIISYKTYKNKVLSNSGFFEQYLSVCFPLFAGRTPSEDNINALYQNHLKFKLSLKFVKTELDQVRDTLRPWTNYSQKYELYVCTQKIDWSYAQSRP